MAGPIVVTLATLTTPSYEQQVVGKQSIIPGIEEFRGIPYGIVPGRWQHALLRDRLPQNVFDATRNGPRCPQAPEPNNSDFYQSELEFPPDVEESEFDCLNLFITRPSAEALAAAGFDVVNRKLPVYVYIHGGAYGFGAGTDPMWDPSRLVSKSISLGTPFIVATVNYRLNTFGFAASTDIINIQSDGQKKGCNFGLGDQRTALEWVQQNIGPFGGDANQVTVGGQSAGGSSSHAHVLQAILGKGKPLCQRGIIQSGAVGVLGPVNLSTADARWSAYCTQLGAPENDLAARMAFMTKVPAAEILRANKKQEYWAFPLVVDNLTISQRPNGRWIVHLDQGHENTTEGGSNKHTDAIDVLIGDTDLEGTLFFAQVSQIDSFEDLHSRLPANVLSREFVNELCAVYGLEHDMTKEKLHNQIYQFLSDLHFGYPVQRSREELMGWESPENHGQCDSLLHRPTKVDSFRISFGNPFPGINHRIAHHCVDLIYIYDCFEDALRAADKAEPVGAVSNASLVDLIQADWIAFITRSKSTPHQSALAKIYQMDRTAVTVDMSSDKIWADRLSRLSLIDKYRQDAKLAANILNGGGHLF